MEVELICSSSILKSAQWLPLYNSTPLICKNPVFAHGFAMALLSTRLHFCLIPTPVNNCLVTLHRDPEQKQTDFDLILKAGMPRVTQSLRSPLLLQRASQNMEERKSDSPDCPLEAALAKETQQFLREAQEQQETQLDVYMDPTVRLKVLMVMTHRMPTNCYTRPDELPDLYRVFLLHCNHRAVASKFAFVDPVSCQTVVSGIWTGLIGRKSYNCVLPKSVPIVDEHVVFSMLYIHLLQRLFEYGVDLQYVDGLLFTAFSALLNCKEPKKMKELFQLNAAKGDPIKAEYAATDSKNGYIHRQLQDHLRSLLAIITGDQPCSLDLIRPLQVAMQIQQMTERKSGFEECVTESVYRREWKPQRIIAPEDIRRKLAKYDAVAQLNDFDIFVKECKEKLLFLAIEDAQATQVFDSLTQAVSVQLLFIANFFDKERNHFVTLLAIRKEDFWGFQRWAAVKTSQEYLQRKKNDILATQWFPCPGATLACQLWMSDHKMHRYRALHLLRGWFGMIETDVPVEETKHVNHLLMALDRILRKPLPSRHQDDLSWFLPRLLCYEIDKDQLRLTDKARKRIIDLQQSTEKSQCDLLMEKFLGLEEKDPRRRPKDLVHEGKTALYCTFVDTMVYLLENGKWSDAYDCNRSFEYKDPSEVHCNNNKTASKSAGKLVKEITDDIDHPYHVYNLQNQARRAKATFDPQANCQCPGAANAWSVFAMAEQSHLQQVLQSAANPLENHPMGSFQHQCLRMFDFPIGYIINDEQSTDVYCHTHFPVRTALPADNPQLDIYPRFRFFQANFGSLVTAKWVHNFSRRLMEEYKDGYLLDMWTFHAMSTEEEDEGKEDKQDPVAHNSQSPQRKRKSPTHGFSYEGQPPQKASKNKQPTPSVINIGQLIVDSRNYGHVQTTDDLRFGYGSMQSSDND